MPQLVSWMLATEATSIGFQKLGQPVPESNLVSDEKRGCPQQTQT